KARPNAEDMAAAETEINGRTARVAVSALGEANDNRLEERDCGVVRRGIEVRQGVRFWGVSRSWTVCVRGVGSVLSVASRQLASPELKGAFGEPMTPTELASGPVVGLKPSQHVAPEPLF